MRPQDLLDRLAAGYEYDPMYGAMCNERDQLKAENAKLRELCSGLAQVVKNDDDTFRRLREIAKRELSCDFIGMYDSSLGEIDQITRFIDSMAELGIKVGASGDSTKGW